MGDHLEEDALRSDPVYQAAALILLPLCKANLIDIHRAEEALAIIAKAIEEAGGTKH